MSLIYTVASMLLEGIRRFSAFLDMTLLDAMLWILGDDIPVWGDLLDLTLGPLFDALSALGIGNNTTVLEFLVGSSIFVLLLVRLAKFFTDLFS